MARRRRRSRRKDSGLFRPPRHKWLAEIITFESVGKAQKAASTLVKALQRGRYGRMKIGERRALVIARALQYAGNRAKASAKRKNLTPEERRKLLRISEIYDRAAERAFSIYDKKYRE